MRTLYCDSRGDRRYSALYAQVTLKDGSVTTIESFYQSVKRDAAGNPVRKGQPVHHIVIHGRTYPASQLTALYEQLWRLYFTQHPELLDYARQFDTFVDRFRGRAINCQADVIRKLVQEVA